MSMGNIGTASVAVTANMAGYNAAVSAMPAQIAAAEQKIKAAILRNRQEIANVLAGKSTANYSDLIRQQENLAKKLQAVQLAAGKAAGALANASQAGSRAGGGGRGGGGGGFGGDKGKGAYRLQQVGQTLDDLQYVGEQGVRPILNNLMQISPILGIIGIAIDQVIRHWSYFTGGPEKAKTAVEQLEAAIKKIEDKPVKFAWDLTELDLAKRKLDELKEKEETIARLRKGRTQESQDLGQSVEKSVGESGGLDQIVEGLLPAHMAQMIKDGTAKGKTAKEYAGLEDAAREMFRDEIVRATKGDEGARRSLIDAGNNRGVGAARRFAANLTQNDPASLERQKEFDAHQEYKKQQAEDAASAVEEGDQLNLQQFQAGKAKRKEAAKKAVDLLGPSFQARLLHANAPVSDVGKDLVGSEAMEKLANAGYDKSKVFTLAKDAVDLALKEIDSRVKERVMAGATPVMARSSVKRELLNEARDEKKAQLQKEFGKAEVLSTDSYLSKIMTAGQSATADPVVAEVKKSNATLETIAKNTARPQGQMAWKRYGKTAKGS